MAAGPRRRRLTALLVAFGALAACRSGGEAVVPSPRPAPPDRWSATATVTSPPAAGPTCRPTLVPAPRELRGTWIATFRNIDWPSRPGLPAARQQQEYRDLLDAAVRMRLNAVFVQVRSVADAFYPSPYEPWSSWLTGEPGTAPGYDALGFLVAEAHRRGLEFHAWLNPYQVTTDGGRLSGLPASHPARLHPDWVLRYGGRTYLDPGVPGVRDYVTRVVLDVVRRYDIDGIHLDDHFYPYPVAGERLDDDATFAAYGSGRRDDWRRANVDALIQQLGTQIYQAKPWVRFGVSPFGIWRNRRDDPAGSPTSGLQSYSDVYADTRRWVRQGWVDYIAPQLYWSFGFPQAPYGELLRWWSDLVAGTRVQLYVGQAAYRMRPDDPQFSDPGEMPRHLTFDRRDPRVRGEVFFSARRLAADPLGFADRLADDFYRQPALVPVTDRVPGPAPVAVTGVRATRTAHGVQVRWARNPDARAYAVYRATGGCGAARLVGVVRDGDGYLDAPSGGSVSGKTYYAVTAVSPAGREGPPSVAVSADNP